ncbi:oligosaccharide flippase family protein, partial [Sphingobacteriaceae bacterium AH-315-L07]|nr:oligosaccharide flippase family protein [Sphingobacteriaceae bacterium AH-315-L07]
MGIITRQGFKLSIVTYIGIVLGYVNVVLLFPNILEPEQFGLTRILIAIGVIALQVGQLGTPQIIIKYFPYFQSEENKHSGILFLMLLINFVG